MSQFPNNNNIQLPRFVYWKIDARAQLPMLLLHAGNKKYIWDDATANTWPEKKDQMPFGQLPVMYHNDLVIPQSGTISRYCASLSDLVPNVNKDSVMSDMLMEHSNDIFNLFSKAKYSGDEEQQRVAWISIRDEKLPKMLKYLENLLENKKYFNGNKVCAGDIAVFSIINLSIRAGLSKCLDEFPNLDRHYSTVFELGTIRDFMEEKHPVYYTAILEENSINETV